jgi:transglutaminase-like putative cysteine protease
MKDGEFNLDIWLRFGAGTYTIWAGDNPNRFDGKIRIVLESSFNQDLRYLAPSAYVDSTNPRLIKLTNSLLKPSMTELEKTKAIYDWVTRNISYDYNAYLKNENILTTASSVLQTKEGLCRDYAFLTAALARAAGLQAKVVYGSTGKSGNWEAGLHAWNEVYADGRWVILDTTWGAGYITNNGKFVSSPSDKYFNPDLVSFAKTHLATSVTYH